MDEVAALSAIFPESLSNIEVSDEGECTFLFSEGKFKIYFSIGSDYPVDGLPIVTLNVDGMSKSVHSTLKERMHSFMEENCRGRECLFDVVAWAEEKVAEVSVEKAEAAEPATSSQSHSTVVLHIDHMRNEAKYLKHLESWSVELGLAVRIVIGELIFVIVEGNIANAKELIVRIRTRSVDVDSSGRPCKERMMTVVHEGKPHATPNFSAISVHRTATRQQMQEVFSDCGLGDLLDTLFIKRTFPS